MTGLPPNDAPRPAHIHTAPGAHCDTGAPVTYPLNDVTVDATGAGTSSTVVTLRADAPVTANNAYVNVHNPAQMGRGVFCGDITVTLTGVSVAPVAPSVAQPAAAPARPAAQRPAAVPAQAAARPVAVPRAGSGGIQADAAAGRGLAGLAAIVVLLGGSGALAFARRRAED
jgi:hypothetical protein